MNRKLTSVLLAILLILSFVVVPAFAQQEKIDVYENQKLIKSVAFIIGVNEYFVNDQVPGVKMDTAPFIQDGRTFVPVRFLGNALGVPDSDIQWTQSERRVDMRRGDNSLSMVIGKPEIKVNGQAKAIDVSPTIKDNRTFLPARYVAEGLGFEVDWDPVNRIVICWPKGEPKPELSNVVKYLQEQKLEQPSTRVLTEEDIKRLQSYPVFDGSDSLQGTVNTDTFRSFEQMQADPELRKDAEWVVENYTLDALLNMREVPIGTIGTYEGQKVLPSLKEYNGAELKWLTDPRLVYETALCQYAERGILLVTFSGPNKFGLVPGQTYEQDVEFRVAYKLDWTTGRPTDRLEQIVLLSEFRPVRR